MNFKPKKSIKSRYSISNINSNLYSTCSIIKSEYTVDGVGYIFVPYILTESINTDDDIYEKIIKHRESQLKNLLD